MNKIQQFRIKIKNFLIDIPILFTNSFKPSAVSSLMAQTCFVDLDCEAN